MKRYLSLVFSLALLSGGWTSPVQAQTPAKGVEQDQQVLITGIYEAFGKGQWKEVNQKFSALSGVQNFDLFREKHPALYMELLYINAQASYNQKQWSQAEGSLKLLTAAQPDHVQALFLSAKVKAQLANKEKKAKKKELLAQSKDLLVQAARSGQFVLRDMQLGESADLFKALRTDPKFMLRVMRASNEIPIQRSGMHNPFIRRIKVVSATDVKDTGDDGKGEDTGGNKVLEELEKKIDSLFKEITRLAEERNVEELIGKFTDLRQIMQQYGKEGSDLVKKKMEKWTAKLAGFKEVQLSIQLQIYINEGNQHLRAMAESIKKDEYDPALERFKRIAELKDQMYEEERPVFKRNADAIYLRGKALADRAARLKKISEFKLDVTGIVIAPPNDDKGNSAIINDRIYREQDVLIDDATEEEVDGLVLVEISRSTVKFQYQDTPFIRELKQP